MIQSTQARSMLTLITQGHRTLDLPLPEAMTAELDRYATVQESARSLDTYDPRALAAATVAALLAGRDPLTDKDVTRHLLAHTLRDAGLTGLVHAHADDARAAVLTEHLPALLESWAAVVADADHKITTARQNYPALDVTDPHAVKAMRPEHMSAWGHAHEAAQRVAQVEGMLVTTLSSLTGAMDPRTRPLLVADLTADQLDDLMPRTGKYPGSADVIRAGHHLSMATPEVYAQRCARVTQERAAAQAQRVADEREAFGRVHRFA